MQMKYRKISDLVKLPQNPRVISDKDFQKLVTSIKKNKAFFEARPCILSNRTGELVILAGNQRYAAALFLGLTEIPTFLIEGLTEIQEKEICIRDNVSSGEWDWELIQADWQEFPTEEWGLTPEGFETDNGYDTNFSLKDGDKAPFQQMTFTLADQQATVIQNAITDIKATDEYKFCETMGNENSNGNALYLIVSQWAGQRK